MKIETQAEKKLKEALAKRKPSVKKNPKKIVMQSSHRAIKPRSKD